MITFLQYVILGLAAGSIYAILGSGVVAIYRASGVLNFAHGALAMVGAMVFYSLYGNTDWPVIPALIAATLTTMALGGLIAWLPLRRLRRSSVLIKVIATVAILLAVQASGNIIWSTQTFTLPNWITDATLRIGELTIPVLSLILLAIATGLTLGVWAITRFTRVGIATSAVAENTRATAALGWSPDVLTTASWILGAGLAAIAGILLSPTAGLQVDALSLLTVPALAVALLADFRSFWLALVGGLGLGIVQSLMAKYVTVQGMTDALPFLVVMVVLIVRGKKLPTRGFVVDRLASFGTGRVRPLVVVPVVLATFALIQYVAGDEFVFAITQSLAFGIVFLSLVLLVGYAGQLSLGQMALAGIGALIAGRLVATTDVPFVLAIVIGVLGTAAAGAIFAVPALRTRGAILGVVTLGMAVTVNGVLFNSRELTGGLDGTLVAGTQSILGIDLDPLLHPRRFALFVLACFVICALVVANIRRGRIGRSLVALRANERAAASLGISVSGCKVYAFTVSAAIAALGGICIAFQQFSIVYFDLFGTFESVLVVAYAVIGGIGYLAGPIVASVMPAGAIGSYGLNEVTGGYSQWIPFIGGVGTLLTIMKFPNGAARAFITLGRLVRRVIAGERPRRPPMELPPGQREPVKPAALRATGVTVRFGAQVAVKDLSLEVHPGEVVGLIGPNGAGKTTMIDAITGYVAPETGQIMLGDERLEHLPVHRRARTGLSRSFQSLELFEDATLLENLRTASDSRDRLGFVTSIFPPRNRPLTPAAVAAIKEFDLLAYLDQLPGELPYGRRRLAAVARAVATHPSVLLLDEPAAGLNSTESAELALLIRRLAEDWGIGILLVEHEMQVVMDVCDRVVVLDFGVEIAQGTPDEISSDPIVIKAYLGEDDDVVVRVGSRSESAAVGSPAGRQGS